MGDVRGGDNRGSREVEILRVASSAGGPVHRAGERDLTIDDHRLGMSDPDISIYPDRHPHELRDRSRSSAHKGSPCRRST
jgi:hypothetical protein